MKPQDVDLIYPALRLVTAVSEKNLRYNDTFVIYVPRTAVEELARALEDAVPGLIAAERKRLRERGRTASQVHRPPKSETPPEE